MFLRIVMHVHEVPWLRGGLFLPNERDPGMPVNTEWNSISKGKTSFSGSSGRVDDVDGMTSLFAVILHCHTDICRDDLR